MWCVLRLSTARFVHHRDQPRVDGNEHSLIFGRRAIHDPLHQTLYITYM